MRAGWPDREIHLFGAGVDSGTYDYFTEAIVGKEGASRGDFTSSEDDNVLVQGIASDELALGFMPYAYYDENKDKLKLVAVDDGKADNGAGPILPSIETGEGRHLPAAVASGLHLRLDQGASTGPRSQQFVEFYLDEGRRRWPRKSATCRSATAGYQLVAGALRGAQDRHRCSSTPARRSGSPSSSC